MPAQYSLLNWLLGLVTFVVLAVGVLLVFSALQPVFGWNIRVFGLSTAVIAVWHFARLWKRAQSGT